MRIVFSVRPFLGTSDIGGGFSLTPKENPGKESIRVLKGRTGYINWLTAKYEHGFIGMIYSQHCFIELIADLFSFCLTYHNQFSNIFDIDDACQLARLPYENNRHFVLVEAFIDIRQWGIDVIINQVSAGDHF